MGSPDQGSTRKERRQHSAIVFRSTALSRCSALFNDEQVMQIEGLKAPEILKHEAYCKLKRRANWPMSFVSIFHWNNGVTIRCAKVEVHRREPASHRDRRVDHEGLNKCYRSLGCSLDALSIPCYALLVTGGMLKSSKAMVNVHLTVQQQLLCWQRVRVVVSSRCLSYHSSASEKLLIVNKQI